MVGCVSSNHDFRSFCLLSLTAFSFVPKELFPQPHCRLLFLAVLSLPRSCFRYCQSNLVLNIPISITCKATTSLCNISATNNMTRQRAIDISASTHTQLTACSSFDSSSSSLESSSLHSNTLYAAKFCRVRLPASCLPLVPDNKDACSDDGTCRIPAE